MRRLIAFPLLVLLLGFGSCATARGEENRIRADDASGTVPQAEPALPHNVLFDQLIGVWDVEYEIFDRDGDVRRYRGQVRYEWILGGRALQETWSSNSGGAEFRPYGTTISFYDSQRRHWTAVWIYPEQGATTVVTGSETDDALVLSGPDQGGGEQRWMTRVTGPNAAEGRYETSDDGGATWRLAGVNHMTRRSE